MTESLSHRVDASRLDTRKSSPQQCTPGRVPANHQTIQFLLVHTSGLIDTDSGPDATLDCGRPSQHNRSTSQNQAAHAPETSSRHHAGPIHTICQSHIPEIPHHPAQATHAIAHTRGSPTTRNSHPRPRDTATHRHAPPGPYESNRNDVRNPNIQHPALLDIPQSEHSTPNMERPNIQHPTSNIQPHPAHMHPSWFS